MDRALELCHEDAHLYRNALMRFASEHGYAPGERAEAVLVLFVAVGCSANVKKSVAYAMDYASASFGHRASTPATEALARPDGPESAEKNLELGLLRVKDGYVAGVPHWLPRSVGGIEIGSLVMGENDITDVGVGVSGRHVRVWHADKDGEKDGWLVEDLGSKNGTVLVSGADHARTRIVPGVPVSLRPGDELELAGDTSFIAIEGTLS